MSRGKRATVESPHMYWVSKRQFFASDFPRKAFSATVVLPVIFARLAPHPHWVSKTRFFASMPLWRRRITLVCALVNKSSVLHFRPQGVQEEKLLGRLSVHTRRGPLNRFAPSAIRVRDRIEVLPLRD